jgi:hypothetical protein
MAVGLKRDIDSPVKPTVLDLLFGTFTVRSPIRTNSGNSVDGLSHDRKEGPPLFLLRTTRSVCSYIEGVLGGRSAVIVGRDRCWLLGTMVGVRSGFQRPPIAPGRNAVVSGGHWILSQSSRRPRSI